MCQGFRLPRISVVFQNLTASIQCVQGTVINSTTGKSLHLLADKLPPQDIFITKGDILLSITIYGSIAMDIHWEKTQQMGDQQENTLRIINFGSKIKCSLQSEGSIKWSRHTHVHMHHTYAHYLLRRRKGRKGEKQREMKPFGMSQAPRSTINICWRLKETLVPQISLESHKCPSVLSYPTNKRTTSNLILPALKSFLTFAYKTLS